MIAAIRNRLTRRARGERGAVLVIAAVCITFVFLPIAALAIDIGSWYQVHRQAQAAADAGALAAADALSTAVGQTIGTANFPAATVTVAAYGSSGTAYQATVTIASPSIFGKILGITSANVSATAVAQNKGASSCSTPGTGCYAIFAMDSNCAGGNWAVYFNGGGNTINGGIATNGSVYGGGGGSSWNGSSTYGPSGAGCTWSPVGGSGSPTHEAAVTNTWPIDYRIDFPPCVGAACTGPSGTPSFCTLANTSAATWNLSTAASGNVYCDVGTGTPSTPSTWNGAIYVTVSMTASYVAGSVQVGGAPTLKACGYTVAGYSAAGCSAAVPTPVTTNYPLIYATALSTTAINDISGGSSYTGDLFAPRGTIHFAGGGNTTGFLEGMDVYYGGGGLTGDGPTYNGTVSSSSSASLLQ